MPSKKPEIVVQQDSTGCGIACAAMLAGQSYHAVKKQAKNIGLIPDDNNVRTDLHDLRMLLEAYRIRIGKKSAFTDWTCLPSPAIIAIQYKKDFDSATWHWAIFHRESGTGPIVLDPSKRLQNNERRDFGKLRPKWFIPVLQS